jgi:hypothetical protein
LSPGISPADIAALIDTGLLAYEAQVYTVILARLAPEVQDQLDALLVTESGAEEEEELPLSLLRRDPGPVGVDSAMNEITKLRALRAIGLPPDLFQGYTPKLVERLRRRIAAESPSHIREHPPAIRLTLFHARLEAIWGEATSTCASDSKKFHAVDQNLLTQWHARYRGPGVLVYWHVERRSVCIYSQLKSCTSSEVAAMLEGVLRNCTDMTIKHHMTDSHGQSESGLR